MLGFSASGLNLCHSPPKIIATDTQNTLTATTDIVLNPFTMACRGICERYRSESQRYNLGIKRCTSCETYLEYDGVQCPCCRTQLRGKRKSK